MHVAVLMPAYNEGERLARTLGELADLARSGAWSVTVFVVDDGSAPPIEHAAVAGADGVRVVLARHVVNLGQGAAIETARRLSLDPAWAPPGAETFDAWITMDADGQHRATDVLELARAIEGGADVALGDRFAGRSNVPFARRVLLRVARVFERLTTGIRLSDAHNGLRAFSRRAVERIRIRQSRMAHATEITRRIAGERDDLSLVEVPVSVRYTDESLAKGQSASGAIAIVVDLFHGFLFGK